MKIPTTRDAVNTIVFKVFLSDFAMKLQIYEIIKLDKIRNTKQCKTNLQQPKFYCSFMIQYILVIVNRKNTIKFADIGRILTNLKGNLSQTLNTHFIEKLQSFDIIFVGALTTIL